MEFTNRETKTKQRVKDSSILRIFTKKAVPKNIYTKDNLIKII